MLIRKLKLPLEKNRRHGKIADKMREIPPGVEMIGWGRVVRALNGDKKSER